ncbi:MAG: hypothetical protein M3Q49_00415 [Actinomycetota bacterium]|nr:hypothetical protein [Actinomycetota bacterium]MDP9484256.1 hypothetical protein [Actinomycetota bacterium]PLS86477.1 MAG: hypothetical protein CYG60_07050 [Actinomycetota bacterium]
MESKPKPIHVDISIDELRVARGSIDRTSVRVRVRGRGEEGADTPSAAVLAGEAPKPVDLMVLKREDGGIELVPRSWRKVRLGAGKPTLYEMARRTPGGLGPVPAVEKASAHAMGLIARSLPDFDGYAPEERAEYLLRTIERVNELSKSHESLVQHLEYAAPGGRKAVPPLKNPDLAVRAAVRREVHGWGTLRIGRELGIPAPPDADIKGENQTVRKMVNRGRPLLEQCFGSEGWRARVERMRAERERWESLGPKQWFYVLLAEERGTSPEEEERAANEDGFDETLGEWMKAWEQHDPYRALRIQLSDPRFDALDRL